MRKLFRRIQYWIRQRQIEADLTEEIEVHRKMKQERLEQSGLPATEATHNSRRALGNVTLARENARAVWIRPWIESVWQDVAYAMRNLRRQPGFTFVALAVLGITIGLNTSLFTVFNAIALRPWPVQDPSSVVNVFSYATDTGSAGGFSLAEYRYFTEHARSFNGLVAMRPEGVRLGFEEVGKRTRCLLVSGNYFRVLGIEMERGRSFLPEEDRLATPQSVAVLSYWLWQNRFGADPDIVGKQVHLDDVPFTIVGVASSDFSSAPSSRDLWIPLSALTVLRPNGSAHDLLRKADYCCSEVAGRIAPAVSRENAQAELELLSHQFRTQHALEASPLGRAQRNRVLLTGTSFLANPTSKRGIVPVFVLMFLGVTLILLLACANVGNLLIARAAARHREIAVRLSLGASRRRLVRQFLTESLVLSIAAAALGIGLAHELPSFMLNQIGESVPFRIVPDATVLGYALALAVIACVTSGLAPALHGTPYQITDALKQNASFAGRRLSLRTVLLSAQVAISVILLSGAGLLVRGVEHARRQDPGFAVDDVAVVSFEFPVASYDPKRTSGFFLQLLRDLEGVHRPFGLALREPLANSRDFTGFRLPGEKQDQQRLVMRQQVSPGYFEVLRIPIVAGRNFDAADADRNSVLINESMARRYWPNENPVGKTIFAGPAAREIVGVVRDAYTSGLDQIEPMLYLPFTTAPTAKLMLRTAGAASSSTVAAIVARLDSRVRIQVTPLSEKLDHWLARSRVGAMLAGLLGAFALMLVTIGMFGVFAYVVQQRTQEIGIRMALGARPPQVIRLVLGTSLRALLIGLAIGVAGSLAASRLLESYLFGLSPWDPVAYGGVALLLSAAGLAATYWPARRATQIDPIQALRYE